MSKEKAIKYIKAAQAAINEEPYPCTTKAKLLLVEALKELEGCMIQKQTWKDEIRILITDEENLGSVQISIPLYISDIFGKADALIYALFVDDTHRRCGVAKRLLQLAEQQAKLNGVKIIGLEFNKDESESFVLEWYLKNGYKPFSKESSLLIKKLED